MKKRYTPNQQAEVPLADDFTALLEALGGLEMIPGNPALGRKFDRIYTALSRLDENDGR